ncbi:MAG: PAS domain-containing protein [Planctomycetes bacterium]|nr:PAS domain-containing protein [Planctomycetota bacterium]
MPDWLSDFSGAVTVCDKAGKILYMNAKSAQTWSRYGGAKLIGKSVLECHPEPARKKLAKMLKDKKFNAYTIEKKGVKKLIYQSPWFQKGKYMGFVELSLVIPSKMKHFIRS